MLSHLRISERTCWAQGARQSRQQPLRTRQLTWGRGEVAVRQAAARQVAVRQVAVRQVRVMLSSSQTAPLLGWQSARGAPQGNPRRRRPPQALQQAAWIGAAAEARRSAADMWRVEMMLGAQAPGRQRADPLLRRLPLLQQLRRRPPPNASRNWSEGCLRGVRASCGAVPRAANRIRQPAACHVCTALLEGGDGARSGGGGG